jgi:hypothetical protein
MGEKHCDGVRYATFHVQLELVKTCPAAVSTQLNGEPNLRNHYSPR